jgi:P4 family phage/plasmid primase-like protien
MNELRREREDGYYEEQDFRPADGPSLTRTHRQYLHDAGISDEIIAGRGFHSVREHGGDPDAIRRMFRESFGIYVRSPEQFEGILIPLHSTDPADFSPVSYTFRPDVPEVDERGKARKYLLPFRQRPVLDVHPVAKQNRWIANADVPLWITEGIKKGDALTSLGRFVITLSGVWNWKSQGEPLPDWDSVVLRGRSVYIAFDADAAVNHKVAQAMHDLGYFLAHEGANVRYIVCPGDPRDKTGVDDFLAEGGTVEELIAVASAEAPKVKRTTANLPETDVYPLLADEFEDKYVWVGSLGWLRWTGAQWKPCSDEHVREVAARWAKAQWEAAMDAAKHEGTADAIDLAKRWLSYCGKSKIDNVLALAKGVLEVQVDQLDADPDLLNCANGTVDLRTGELLPHNPADLITRTAGAPYEAGATHADWAKALEALPEDVRWWLMVRFGQAITGHVPDDDIMPFLKGSGANGKSTVVNAISRALGDYYLVVSPKALLADVKAHSTDLADFRGVRFAVLEELPERHMDVTRVKQLNGDTHITARHLFKDNMTFFPSHSMFVTTNYVPNVSETDHGTWRRLMLITFPYTFTDDPDPEIPSQKEGDPGLRQRIAADHDGAISKAVLAGLVNGAVQWYQFGMRLPEPPASVAGDTQTWRMQSDSILRFWNERLVADPDSVVPSSDMLRAYNEWAESLGLQKISDKTLADRLGSHQETERNHVTGPKQIRVGRRSVSRYLDYGEVPAKIRGWDGVRLTPLDDSDR